MMKTKGHARGARRVEGTGITDLRPLADSLDTYARQIHSTAEIVRVQLEVLEARSIEEESAEQSTEAKAAENTAPCSPHDGHQHLTSTSPAVGWRPLPTLDRTPVIEAHAAPIVDTISPEAIWQRISGARKAAEVRAIEWMPDRLCAMEQNSVRATSIGANAAEPVERRAGAKGNAHQQSTHWTQNQARVSQALERIRQAIAVIHPRWEKLWGGRRRLWHLHRPQRTDGGCPVLQVNDLSRSLAAFDPISTLVVVVEMSKASWLVRSVVPGVERQPLKKLEPDAMALLRLIERWRSEAVRAGRPISRVALAYEAGRDGFWLARWLIARGIEAHVIHSASVAVSRERKRAKTDLWMRR